MRAQAELARRQAEPAQWQAEPAQWQAEPAQWQAEPARRLAEPARRLAEPARRLGGAVAAVAPGDTAFPHRSALASVQIHKSTNAAGRAAAAQQVGEVQSALADLAGGGAYINYIDPTQADWAAAAYGDNLARLAQVSKACDPDGFFSFAQAIPRS